ncbi:MAG: FAD:protein FMN transferase [Oscillospiraceae bacterium]|nr:FAD:protein FMN transferase [Oscillospiraceae bacterium]
MKKSSIVIYVISFLLLAGAGVLFIFRENLAQLIEIQVAPPVTNTDGFFMDTFITQSVHSDDEEIRSQVSTQITDMIADVESKTSMYIQDSDIYKINKAPWGGLLGSHTQVSQFTFDLLKDARHWGLKWGGGGYFDVTIGALTEVWNFDPLNPKIPPQSEAERLKNHVNCTFMHLTDEANRIVNMRDPFARIDLGGIAKGHAAGLALEIYKNSDIKGALLSIGGSSIATYGTKQDGMFYEIGIRDPDGDNADDLIGYYNGINTTISTAGAYERYFEQDGRIYHHILDPHTGYPAESDLKSVTVISENGALADAYATYLFIRGSEYIKSVIADPYEDAGIIAIDKNNNVYVSEDVLDSFTLTSNRYKIV